MKKLVVIGSVGAALLAVNVGAPTAEAIDTTKGYAGLCTGADALTGTTMVVDFRALNGNGGTAAPTITRCSPNPRPGTSRSGIQALQDAGLTPTGTARWGLAFVCRIEGRPSAAESLPVSGSPTYKEACVNTPPAAAYWSYWYADGSDSSWTYSSFGAANRTVVPGGFDGWSFALNTSTANNPAPRVTPRNSSVGATSPTVSLSINDLDRGILLGQSVTLTWASARTVKRTAAATPKSGAGAWSGTVAAGGTKTVKPTKKGTFTYKITGRRGTQTGVATAVLTVR